MSAFCGDDDMNGFEGYDKIFFKSPFINVFEIEVEAFTEGFDGTSS